MADPPNRSTAIRRRIAGPKSFARAMAPARRETPAATIATAPSAQGTRLGAPRDATPRQEDIEADQ